MQEARCALVIDDDRASLGEIAVRILRLGIDVFYSKDPAEAQLLAQQEAMRIRALLCAATVEPEEIARIGHTLHSLEPEIPRTLVAIGRRPDDERRKSLREAGVEWALWEPYDECGLRSVLSSAIAARPETAQRKQARLPTMLLARAFVGARRHDAIVATLSEAGAFLETPSPIPEGTVMTLEISLMDGPLQVKARVAYARYPTGGAPAYLPSGMGVEFTVIAVEVAERLRRYLREIEERFLV
jgi:hypothetical protein